MAANVQSRNDDNSIMLNMYQAFNCTLPIGALL